MSQNPVFSEKDLNPMYETFTSQYKSSVIEELNDFTYLKRLFGSSRSNSLKLFLILFLVSLFTSMIAALVDISAYNIGYYKKVAAFEFSNPYESFIIWTSISILFACIGTTFGYKYCPEVDGSGIPEVKAIISGAELPRFLFWRTFFLKAAGLVCCSVSLSIGREGPHIHLATILAHKLMKTRYFRDLGYFKATCTQIYQASVTAGVAAVLGTPLGATFFCIEITASYYIVHNLISSLGVGLICSIFLKIYHYLYLTEDIYPTEVYEGYNYIDLILVAALGVLCGLFGVCFVKLAKFLTRLRARRAILVLHKRYRYAIFAAFMYSLACFLIPTLRISAKSSFNQLIDKEKLDGIWETNSVFTLLTFSFSKAVLTALSCSVQIPFGIFLPVLDCGAAFGRVFGELGKMLGGQAHISMYAAVGGAALIGSATHALSATLIIAELTGEVRYIIPMSIATVIACQIAKSLELNIYDVTIQTRSIPFLPAVRRDDLYSHYAKDIMEPVTFLCIYSRIDEVKPCLHLPDEEKVAIVDEDNYLIAETSLRRVKKYIDWEIRKFAGKNNDLKEELEIWKKFKNYECLSVETRVGQELERFFRLNVDFTHRILVLNTDPISIPVYSNLYQIHFMFHMLGIVKIYVTNKSKLVGIIKRDSFVSCKK